MSVVAMIFLMLAQTAMLAFSQVALKLGLEGLQWEWSWPFFLHHVLLNAWLMTAVVLLIGANLFWFWLLTKFPLSQIYPLTSLGFVFGMLGGLFLLGEKVDVLQWVGVTLVIAGCMFVAKVWEKPKEEKEPTTLVESQKSGIYEEVQGVREDQEVLDIH